MLGALPDTVATLAAPMVTDALVHLLARSTARSATATWSRPSGSMLAALPRASANPLAVVADAMVARSFLRAGVLS